MRTYKLEKISIKEGCSSVIFPGHSAIGLLGRGYKIDGEMQVEDEAIIHDIEVGNVIVVNYTNPFYFLKTSEILSITKTIDYFELETTTSIYRIEEVSGVGE